MTEAMNYSTYITPNPNPNRTRTLTPNPNPNPNPNSNPNPETEPEPEPFGPNSELKFGFGACLVETKKVGRV